MSRHYRKVALAFCFSALLITAWMRLALADGGIFPIVMRAFEKFSIIVKGVNQPSHFKNKP
ncbi:hypothetical protein [Fervidibacter sacchari]